jgi:hypothetical protein
MGTMTTKPADLGPRVVQQLVEALQLDEGWSMRARRSFAWWGHHLAQRVWAERPHRQDGADRTRVQASTVVLKGVKRQPQTLETIASLNRFATFSALVWNPYSGEVALHSSAYFTRDNARWLQAVFAKAITMQAAEAHVQLETLLGLLGGRPAWSDHPKRGHRHDPDSKLDVLGTVYARVGGGSSPFTGADFDATLQMEQPPWASAGVEGRTLTAEIPLDAGAGPRALLTATSEGSHPQLGSGLLLRLRLPDPPALPAAELSGRLNTAEAFEWTDANLFGAWCSGHDEHLWFALFLPAGLYEPGLLGLMIRNAVARVHWAIAQLPRLEARKEERGDEPRR